MKRNVTEYDFERAFAEMGRNDQFSYEGLKALYEWFEEYEEGTGEEIELDVIAICCDFSEYETAREAALEYGFDPELEDDEDDDEDDREEKALDWLKDRTSVIVVPVPQYSGGRSFHGSVIIQGF